MNDSIRLAFIIATKESMDLSLDEAIFNVNKWAEIAKIDLQNQEHALNPRTRKFMRDVNTQMKKYCDEVYYKKIN